RLQQCADSKRYVGRDTSFLGLSGPRVRRTSESELPPLPVAPVINRRNSRYLIGSSCFRAADPLRVALRQATVLPGEKKSCRSTAHRKSTALHPSMARTRRAPSN